MMDNLQVQDLPARSQYSDTLSAMLFNDSNFLDNLESNVSDNGSSTTSLPEIRWKDDQDLDNNIAITDLERKDLDPAYEAELDELKQDLEDWKVILEMLGAVYDEEGTRRSFTEWFEKVPPAEREERLRELDRKLRQASDFVIESEVENGEVVKVEMINSLGQVMWLLGEYDFNLYTKEE